MQGRDVMCSRVNVWGKVGGAVAVAIALMPSSAVARSCPVAPAVAPSAALKEFRVEEFGLALTIPSNYRSVLRSNGHITFHDPATFELIQCLARTGDYQTVPPHTVLEIYRGIRPETAVENIVALLRLRRPWLDFYQPEYESVRFAGQAAVYYEYTNPVYQLTIANLSFLARDRRTLLTLSGPADHPILVNAIATMQTVTVPTAND